MLIVRDLSLSYANLKVLQGLSLQLMPGTITVLKGANGCGKSSLLSAISGVVPEYIPAELSGTITLDGVDLRAVPLREKYHYLWHALSEASGQFFFPCCEAELAFALENMGIPPGEIERRIKAAADFFGFAKLQSFSPQNLSGGQQKLFLAAIGMAMDPPLLLLDEPASGLSSRALALFCAWLQETKQRGKIVLIAEHHPAIIAKADQLIELPSREAR